MTDVQFLQDPAPSRTSLRLAALAADNSLLLLDVLNRGLAPAWRRGGEGGGAKVRGRGRDRRPVVVPERVRSMPAPLSGMSVDPAQPHRLLLYSHAYAVWVDLTRASDAKKVALTSGSVQTSGLQMHLKSLEGRKRRRTDSEDAQSYANFIVFNVYRNIIHFGLLPGNRMVNK